MMFELQYQPLEKSKDSMIYSGVISLMRTLGKCFAGKEPVQKRHQITAGMVLCGALVFPQLIFGRLHKFFPQLKNIFDVWYGGVCFFAGMSLLIILWGLFCILLKKWYVAMILSIGIIISWIIQIAN